MRLGGQAPAAHGAGERHRFFQLAAIVPDKTRKRTSLLRQPGKCQAPSASARIADTPTKAGYGAVITKVGTWAR